jgi:hypothetical protein
MTEIWKPFHVDFNSSFMPIFSKVIKTIEDKKEDLTIAVINRDKSNKLKMEVKEHFKFIFDWSDENLGIEVFKKIEVES